MTPAALVVAILVALARAGVPAGEYRDDLAVAVAEASRGDLATAGLLLAVAEGESSFRPRIADCDCPRGTCDPDAMGIPRARGAWQAHRYGAAARHWGALCGDLRLQARIAAAHLRWAVRRCGSVAGGVAHYASGHSCEVDKRAADREARARQFTAAIRRAASE